MLSIFIFAARRRRTRKFDLKKSARMRTNDCRRNFRSSGAISRLRYRTLPGPNSLDSELSRSAAQVEFQNQPDGDPRAKRNLNPTLWGVFFCRPALAG